MPDRRFYFWKIFRTYNREDAELSKTIDQAVKTAFGTEDEPMILAVQERMEGAEFWSLKPVLLKTDAAAVMARRTLTRLTAM